MGHAPHRLSDYELTRNAFRVFKYLKPRAKGLLGERIAWNFTKFLVNKRGEVIHRYAPTTKPQSIAADIEKALAETV